MPVMPASASTCVDRAGMCEQAGGVLHGLADVEVLEQPAALHHRGDEATRDGLAWRETEHADVATGRLG